MAKFNTKRETKHVPSETNKMGEAVFKLDPKEELVSTVLTTFVQKSYYEAENEILERIKNAAMGCDPLFVAKTALYTRISANMRSSSHVLATELAPRLSGTEWGGRFYTKVLVRPDDMSEILSYYFNVMKGAAIPNAMRRGFKAKLESMDPYLIDKYKMLGRDISLIDLVNLIRPEPTQSNTEAYKLLMKEGGKGLDKLYGSKILEKEMSKAGKVKPEDQKTVAEAKREAIEDTLGNIKGMPIFNLLRNLRNIMLYAPDSVDTAIFQLTNEKTIHKSKLLPFRFLSAYNEIIRADYASGGDSSPSEIVFEDDRSARMATAGEFRTLKTKVLAGLETAIEHSCYNIPELEGRTAILIDHSGSMRGDGGGASLVSALSKTTMVDIADVFASMLLHKQENVYVGLFGDRLVPFKVDRTGGILETARSIFRAGQTCGGATEAGIYDFFEELLRRKIGVDNIIVFSDQVIGNNNGWYGRGICGGYSTSTGQFQTMFKDFRKMYPHTTVTSVDIHQTDGTTVFNKNDQVTQVAGWSEKIFDIISSGTAGYKAIIEEIEKIVI
jgi:hypothetical protein